MAGPRAKRTLIDLGVFLLILGAAVLLSLSVSCNESGKQDKSAEVYQASFINGIGKAISSITLTPNGKNAENAFKFSLDLQDKGVSTLNLPLVLKNYDEISAEIEFDNGKSAAMKKRETISLSNDSTENVFLLSLKGKKSSVPLVAAGTAGSATAAAIAGAAAYCVAQWGLAV